MVLGLIPLSAQSQFRLCQEGHSKLYQNTLCSTTVVNLVVYHKYSVPLVL